MTQDHRSLGIRALALGAAGLLLALAASARWWMQHANGDDQETSEHVNAGNSTTPPPGERLLGQKGVIRRWADNDDFADLWIYGDLDQGFEEAQQTGRPLLVTYRCVP